MKIEYIKLKNYIGIYNGTGLTEIEVDMSKGDNIISLLSGENGSGKSTLLSTLHPFASTMDGRSSIILPGMDGYKEVHISEGDNVYKIEHHYLAQANGSVKMKSFFAKKSKNDAKFKQLNPNGTVKSFKELVQKELDVDESFFKLVRIGSDTAGFIDMLPSKRKEYLSTFLSEVDRFLQAYKTVNAKYSAVNKNIKFIVDQINKLEDEDRLNDRKKNLTNQLNNIGESKNKLESILNQNIGEITVLDPDQMIDIEYSNKFNKMNEIKREIVALDQNLNSMITEFSDIEDFSVYMNKLETEKQLTQQKLDRNIKEFEEYKEEMLSLKNELFEIDEQIKGFNVEKTVSEYKELIEHYDANKQELEDFIQEKEEEMDKYRHLDPEWIKIASTRLDRVISQIDKLTSQYNLEDIMSISSFDRNYAREELKVLQSKKATLTEEIVSCKSMIKVYSNDLQLSRILNDRPEGCNIDDCPFIANALKLVGSDKKLTEEQRKLVLHEGELERVEKSMKSLMDKVNLFNQLETIYSSNIDDYVNTFTSLPYGEHFSSFENFLANITKDKSMIDYSEILEFRSVEMEVIDLQIKINGLIKEMQNVEKIEGVLNSLKANREKVDTKLTSAHLNVLATKNEVKELRNDILDIEDEMECVKEIIEKENEKKEKEAEVQEIRSYLISIKEKVKRIKELKSENEDHETDIELYQRDIDRLNKELDDVKFNIEKLSEYKERKQELDERFTTLSTLRTALSTTKGIPLLFIEVYLKKTKKIANELLQIIFKGNFYIEDFKLTDSDFFISVRKPDGEVVEDVTQASQGEKALISIALSFALIQQSLKKYNILCLDEMDSTLDSANRRSFIDMIERQLKVMGVEQCFIITHNEAFDPYPVNLLLFPGSSVDKNNEEFIVNKTIVSDLTEF